MKHLANELDKLRENNLFRSRRLNSTAQQIEPVINGKKVLSFCSNDYLGLANHPKVIESFTKACKEFGVGSGASHLITGHHESHAALEEELAGFIGCERALLFSTGYMANLGAVSALTNRNSFIFADKLNHASLNDAAILSRANLVRHDHLDLAQLESNVAAKPDSQKLILSDGVFSMDGTIASIAKLQSIAKQFEAKVLIDDAHGIGVLGALGKGCTEGKLGPQTILVGTLGKAFGTFGAFIAANEETIEWLIQKAHSYIYTTALPPAIAEASRTSLTLIKTEAGRRSKLQKLTDYFRHCCEQAGVKLTASTTPIQPVTVGHSKLAMQISNSLLQAGILVPAIRPPTVPENSARLRITLCAEHTHGHIDELVSHLARSNVNS